MIKVKGQNSQLERLIQIYTKLSMVDFPSAKDALAHIKDLQKLEAEWSKVEKLREAIVKKNKLDKEPDNKEANVKANEEYIKVLLEQFELELNQMPQAVIDLLTAPADLLLLDKLGIKKID